MKPALFERLGDDFTRAFGNSVLLSGSFGSRTITAIFREYRERDVLEGDFAGVETPRFVLKGRACDLADIVQNDVVSLATKDYRVTSVTDDGRAMRTLFLTDC